MDISSKIHSFDGVFSNNFCANTSLNALWIFFGIFCWDEWEKEEYLCNPKRNFEAWNLVPWTTKVTSHNLLRFCWEAAVNWAIHACRATSLSWRVLLAIANWRRSLGGWEGAQKPGNSNLGWRNTKLTKRIKHNRVPYTATHESLPRPLIYYITDCVTPLILGETRSAGSESATGLTFHQSVLEVPSVLVRHLNVDETHQ